MDLLTVLSTCTGQGGIELGLRLAGKVLGFEAVTLCYVEREIYAAAILAAKMESGQLDKAPVWSDVHTFPAGRYRGKVDVLTGGFPCQPFSMAGKRKGVDDPRHLWPAIAQIIGIVQPPVVFLENVPGIFTTRDEHGRPAYGLVRDDLEAMAYRVVPGVYSSRETGGSHQRRRVFILAVGHGNQPRADVHDTLDWRRQGCGLHAGLSGQEQAPIELDGPIWPPYRNDLEGWWEVLRETPWLAPAVPTESSLRRVADELPGWLEQCHSHRIDRLRTLGNSVDPVVAALAFIDLWGK